MLKIDNCADGLFVVCGADAVTAPGDVITVNCVGTTSTQTSTPYAAAPMTADAGMVGLSFIYVPPVPQSFVQQLGGGTLAISYSVRSGNGGATRTSRVTQLTVEGTSVPSDNASTLQVVGQRSSLSSFTNRVDADAPGRPVVQVLTALLIPSSPSVAATQTSATWAYSDGTSVTGTYFYDVRPDMALTVSVTKVSGVKPVVLARNPLARSAKRNCIIDDIGMAHTWDKTSAERNQLVYPGVASACGRESDMLLIQTSKVVKVLDSATPLSLDGTADVVAAASTENSYMLLSSSGRVNEYGASDFVTTDAASVTSVFSIATTLALSALRTPAGSLTSFDEAGKLVTTPTGSSMHTVAALPSQDAFVAVYDNGTVTGWGNNSYGAIVPLHLGPVTAVTSSLYGFAAIQATGTVLAWGLANGATIVPANTQNAIFIAGALASYAALMPDGSVVTWGSLAQPATAPRNVINLVAADRLFAALQRDGRVVVWGSTITAADTTPSSWSDVVALQSCGEVIYAVSKSGDVHYCSSRNTNDAPPDGLLPQLQQRLTLVK
ncbi:hypothetical protein ASB57_19080 [Bordetella sp. N]|nr:hypothetical protein ASB57_19080 [Bordetella sp. N]